MKVLQVVALLALASQAMAQSWCAAPTLNCLSTGSWTSSLAVEISLAGIANSQINKYQKFSIEAFTDKGSFCKATITPCPAKDTVAFWFGPAPTGIAPWTSDVTCSTPVPCGTQFVIQVKNSDGQIYVKTCYSQACPAVSAPPPCVASPPPYVCSSPPPPVPVSSPPPCVASPPPYVCSSPPPPPVKVYSPPCVASPPPYCMPTPVTVSSPPPYICSSPPPKYCQPPVTVSSPPPYCQSPPPKCQSPVTVSSPPPYCQSPPPKCQSPVAVSAPPPKYCQPPVTIYHKPPPSCGPQCGVTKWGKPVYCKPGKKCCTVTVKKWHGKHCQTYTKQECMKKCPKH